MAICRFSMDAARRDHTPVDNRFIAEYMPAAPGDAVRVYLYGLMQCRFPTMGDVPLTEALGMTEEDVEAAFVYWQEQNLVRITGTKPLTVEYQPIYGDGAPVTEAVTTRYGALVRRIHSLIAPRQFGMNELRHVYDWIEVYGLEEGAVTELIAHCMDLKGPRVSVNYMSEVARSWSERGVVTMEAARKDIEEYAMSKSGAAAILKAWNKRRKPTEDEQNLYRKWTEDWGFTPEAIMEALPRMTVTGSANFTYLDEILEQLHSNDLTDRAQIAEDDKNAREEQAFARQLFEASGKAGNPTATHRAQIGLYLGSYGMSKELLLYAAERARGANEPFGMMKRILNDWHEQGIDTVEKAKEAPAAAPARKSEPERHKYTHRTVTEKDYEGLYLDLNEDL